MFANYSANSLIEYCDKNNIDCTYDVPPTIYSRADWTRTNTLAVAFY